MLARHARLTGEISVMRERKSRATRGAPRGKCGAPYIGSSGGVLQGHEARDDWGSASDGQ